MALLKVLLLLLGLGVSLNSGVSLQKRIIGGQNCDDRDHLYYVRLDSNNGTHRIRCGGSLIHRQWILTTTVLTIYALFGKQHDIMMLKLETPVSGVPLAQLPDCRRLRISAIPANLQCVNMDVVKVSLFEPKHGHYFRISAPNKDICYVSLFLQYRSTMIRRLFCFTGDDGGAAMYDGMIYGVISIVREDVCRSPVAIMDVCEYLGWIKHKLS
uniref:Peptidase S1 domain-containing protein n=1 Tax=Poecilia reticulata TaxID=8081 RepID=A0A3P9P196_POERE